MAVVVANSVSLVLLLRLRLPANRVVDYAHVSVLLKPFAIPGDTLQTCATYTLESISSTRVETRLTPEPLILLDLLQLHRPAHQPKNDFVHIAVHSGDRFSFVFHGFELRP